MLWQPSLPPTYTQMTDEQLAAAIGERRARLGDDLVVLGHHYQQDEVIAFADFTGDSFKLSQIAAQQVNKTGAKYVIFLGVHFMAESADILTPEDTVVILPDLSAGCSMADMADYDDTVDAWAQLEDTLKGTNTRIVPVCYMNSSAAIKAFCGEHGGAACTSSNCSRVFEWAMAGGDTPLRDGEMTKILFLPDQHLGRNTAASLGYDIYADMCLWDPKHLDDLGGCDQEEIRQSRFILWKGHCSVHKLFRPEHVDQVRAQWPDVKVIVHPECSYEVMQKADLIGSTEGIVKAIQNAESGTRWAVGTEVHLVNRLACQATPRGVNVRILSDCQCLCTTMYRIDMPHLLWVMDNLLDGQIVNRISVNPTVQRRSLVALNRMLELTASDQLAETPSVIEQQAV